MRGNAMPWFKVDDGLHSHSKVDDAGVHAIGLWTLAGSWSSDQLTDGWVPLARVLKIDPADGVMLARRLVAAGFWHDAPDCPCIPSGSPLHAGKSGWHFHDWGERQPARQDVMERRERHAQRQREWRQRRAQAPRDSASGAASGVTSNGASAGRPTRPDPTTTRSVVVGGERASDDPTRRTGGSDSPHAKRMISDIRTRLRTGISPLFDDGRIPRHDSGGKATESEAVNSHDETGPRESSDARQPDGVD